MSSTPEVEALRRLGEGEQFAALGCRRVHDVELDLLGQLLLVVPVGLYGVAAVVGAYWAPPEAIGIAFGWSACVIMVGASALAGVELLGCYRVRRTGAVGRHTRITPALWVVGTGSVPMLIYMLRG